MNDLNIINGTIVRPEGCIEADLAVSEGKIVSVAAPGQLRENAKETIDAKGKLIFPGMIDTHVHIRGGKLSHREDFFSGTVAAASGGITTIMEMPIANPPASTAEAFQARLQEIDASACVDFCMYGGAGSDNLDQISALAELGAVAYKTFLMPPVPGREKEFYGLCCESYDDLVSAMSQVHKTGLLLACHSELNEYVAESTARIMAQGRNGVKAFGESRPKEAETQAVKRVIAAAEKTGCKASICHVSVPETVELIEQARAEGVDIHGETCPQYLLFNDCNAEFAGVFARMKPPLRSPETMEKLLDAYADGRLEITGSDHAPYTREEKLKNGNDIWHCFDGLPGLELSLLLLLNKVVDGKLSYRQVVRNTAENPAALFGIDDRKGRIEPGRDADLVIIERLAAPHTLHTSDMFTKSKESAVLYEGTPLYHRVERTLVRGATVFQDGKFTGSTGFGQLIKPQKEKKEKGVDQNENRHAR